MDESKPYEDSSIVPWRSFRKVVKLCILRLVADAAEKLLKDGKSVRLSTFSTDPSSFSTKELASRGYYYKGGLFPLNFIIFPAHLLIKLIEFQFNILMRLFTFPIWVLYTSFMFFIFPLQTLSQVRVFVVRKLLQLLVSSRKNVTDKARKFVSNGVLRFCYVFFMVLGLLASGFLLGSFTVKSIIVKPIQVTETLNFDYTKPSPSALLPIMSPAAIEAAKRAIPYNQKLQLTVSLVLPESEYNRKLGIFQVRAELMSAKGEVLMSSRYPTMMKYKSQQLRVAESIMKIVPVIAGLQSESNIINIKMNDFIEGIEPTALLKVTLEQRAEFGPGEGIPEIYDASLVLESQLPQLKKTIWYWRRLIILWTSFMIFLLELILVLVFCKPVFFTRGSRPRITYAKRR